MKSVTRSIDIWWDGVGVRELSLRSLDTEWERRQQAAEGAVTEQQSVILRRRKGSHGLGQGLSRGGQRRVNAVEGLT